MDIQLILVIALFIAAAFYIGRLIFRAAQVKDNGCGASCKCGVDFDQVNQAK